MDRRINRIVVVGGGTAGWLSAAYLNRGLGDSVEITLIESSSVPGVGVGEATIPTLRATLRFLGFEDEEWMPSVGATYKAAIRFVDWAEGPTGSSFWHPFVDRPVPSVLPFEAPYFAEIGRGVPLLQYALKRRLDGATEPIASMLSPIPALCDQKLSPIHPERPELNQSTAYHIDAGLFAKFLRDACVRRGVHHVVGHVADVELDDRGHIGAVLTTGGERLEGDLFIDCTGFRGLLINEAMGEPFLSDSHRLLCDAAVAVPADKDPERDGIASHTDATALRHGWAWQVPLFHRDGCGYVYCSRTASGDEAERELRDFLGSDCASHDAKHIRMRVGRSRNLWSRNCVAVGLSGAFIEPLESTGIFLIELGLATLLSLFPSREFCPGTIRKYNSIMSDMYEEVRDFVVLHYVLSRRADTPFWEAVQHETEVPDTLREKLELFEANLPLLDELKLAIFPAASYTCILDGFGRLPKRAYPLLEHIGYEAGERALDALAARTREIVSAMPSHHALLRHRRR